MTDKEKVEEPYYIDINMEVVAKYIAEKYVLPASFDEYDTVYIPFDTGRIIITYEELLEFLDNNQAQYIENGWTWTDLIDIYFVYCLTSALNKLTESIYHSNNTILQ